MEIDLPPTSGEALFKGRIKSLPADFIVREELGFEFDEAGEHLYLYIRKCGLNTNDLQEALQTIFSCQSVDVGVSGLKDKNAITDQWFSIKTPKSVEDVAIQTITGNEENELPVGEFAVLASHRHSRKLRRGAHQYNAFSITVRDIAIPDKDARSIDSYAYDDSLEAILNERMKLIQANGFANYFGPQRFGINHQNLPKARRYFENPKRKITRTQRSLLISSARSQLFNRVCAARVKDGSWNQPMLGEPMLLAGSHSFFTNIGEADVELRCGAHDIHPTGPLWGDGDNLATDTCKAYEEQALLTYATYRQGLQAAGLKQQRRALRANVDTLSWSWPSLDTVTLNFKLLKGVYATCFLSEFMINL